MAEIRTVQKKGTPWTWILLALLLIAVVVAALVWLGYIELPGGAVAGNAAPAGEQRLAAVHAYLMRSI